MSTAAEQPVALVTGGARGIGAAAARSLGALGYHVVTVDPEVSIAGESHEHQEGPSTAELICADGGSAESSGLSVEDRAGLAALVENLLASRGRLDAVINVAGISRPTSFLRGSDADWNDVLSVHLSGYLNVLAATLPAMVAAKRGHILGVTSGGGWRPADSGAYSLAKRCVAAVTWELAPLLPEGVVLNAISPIALTRMVAAALARSGASSGGSSASGGLALGSGMPDPTSLGPLAAHLVADSFDALRGEVIFLAGSELALISAPRLIEVLRTDDVADHGALLEGVLPKAFVPAEEQQRTVGATNERFAALFDGSHEERAQSPAGRCALVVADPVLRAELRAVLETSNVTCVEIDPLATSVDEATTRLHEAGGADLGSVLIALTPIPESAASPAGWEAILSEHDKVLPDVLAHVAWVRAATAARASGTQRRIVSIIEATSPSGRTIAQAVAQLARSSRGATGDEVAAFAVGLESPLPAATTAIAALSAQLLARPDVLPLAGAELAVGEGWIGLRRHPAAAGAVVIGSNIPTWLDMVLAEMAGVKTANRLDHQAGGQSS